MINTYCEVDKCDVCGKEGPVTRTTYYIEGLKCLCHSPQHFMLVRTCKDCAPVKPTFTKVSLRLDNPLVNFADLLDHDTCAGEIRCLFNVEKLEQLLAEAR